jgi:hypothetical protein
MSCCWCRAKNIAKICFSCHPGVYYIFYAYFHIAFIDVSQACWITLMHLLGGK